MKENLHILVVEDDRRLAGLVRAYLEQQGYRVSVERRGDRAVQRILYERPDLVILDLMLPGEDGLTVCQRVRADFEGPILILTAREEDMDQVAGLEMGADDYVKKPVEPRVLLARIRALLRRVARVDEPVSSAPVGTPDELVYGSLRINRSAQRAVLEGEAVELTTNEFEMLWLLAANAGTVMDRSTILKVLRGVSYDGLDRSVDVAVSRLRKKLGDNATPPERIKTVWGQGYLFVRDAW